MKAEHKFSFDALCGGKLGLTPTAGAFLSESAEFCLFKNDHPGPVTLNITGDAETSGVLQWSRPADEKTAERTYGNQKEAAEDGAYAIAIVVVTQLERFPAVAKSPIGTGMDYWVTGDDDTEIFLARLEVSGIFKGSPSQIGSRLKTKLEQTKHQMRRNFLPMLRLWSSALLKSECASAMLTVSHNANNERTTSAGDGIHG